MTLAIAQRRGGMARTRPAVAARQDRHGRLAGALGVLADAGLLLSLGLVLIGWGMAGILTGIVLGGISLGLLVWTLARRDGSSHPLHSELPAQTALDRAA